MPGLSAAVNDTSAALRQVPAPGSHGPLSSRNEKKFPSPHTTSCVLRKKKILEHRTSASCWRLKFLWTIYIGWWRGSLDFSHCFIHGPPLYNFGTFDDGYKCSSIVGSKPIEKVWGARRDFPIILAYNKNVNFYGVAYSLMIPDFCPSKARNWWGHGALIPFPPYCLVFKKSLLLYWKPFSWLLFDASWLLCRK